jgi:hypothetical protein
MGATENMFPLSFNEIPSFISVPVPRSCAILGSGFLHRSM